MVAHDAYQRSLGGQPAPVLNGYYPAFDVQPGDRLYLTPEERVRLW